MTPDTFGLVALALYLCAEEPDIVSSRPQPPRRKAKLKAGPGLTEALKVTFYQVGETLARKIREAEAVERGPISERAAPRPHLRRGHWHHFWTGPKESDNRKLIVRFLMPTLVGG